MNRTKIKNYAPKARRDFIQAVTDRAAYYGLTEKRIEPVTVQGDVALIAGRAFPREVADKRRALQERVERDGFGLTMEAMAYTWFNRLVAIRYMELHEYLDHGYRVLSHPDPAKSIPEILEHAEHVELPGLNRERVIELKLDGTKEAELYRLLLVAQCNALHSAMPFLFERIGDETELVLPESLLHSDSIVRKLVSGIDDEDWQEVEVIGWLYEAYISERYEAVIGSVVASADIPAATQRFTPKWIVRYLVQNTLGRQWMATYPQSPLKGQMKYYIEPAEQTPEVQEQLRAITPTSLNPEEITFLDPACGSAHILVEAYDLFKAIYLERGYRPKDIPRLILGKNIFGLEIDDRAAQLASFALMMKARADDHRMFEQGVQPHIRALVQTDGMDAEDIAAALNIWMSKKGALSGLQFEDANKPLTQLMTTTSESPTIALSDVKAIIELFDRSRTFGSLIQVPSTLCGRLSQIEQYCREIAGQTSEFASRTAAKFLPVIDQARMLAGRYDCVVANPPYMGSKFYNSSLKTYVGKYYNDAKADLCVAFIEKALQIAKPRGFVGEVVMQNWMFLSTFEAFRLKLLNSNSIRCMAHLGPHAFPNIGGQVVQVTSFVVSPVAISDYRGSYKRLVDGQSHEKECRFSEVENFTPSNSDFTKIPGSPLAYWSTNAVREAFIRGIPLGKEANVCVGLQTGKNAKFVRHWAEVAIDKVAFNSKDRIDAANSLAKWFPYNKGGEFRKWYGNQEFVVNWEKDGREVRSEKNELGQIGSRPQNVEFYFRPSGSWSKITVSSFSMRYFPPGFIFDVAGCSVFSSNENCLFAVIALLNSRLVVPLLSTLAPSVNFEVGQVSAVPLPRVWDEIIELAAETASAAISMARVDWNQYETSWDFERLPVIELRASTLRQSQNEADAECLTRLRKMKVIELENSRLFIEAYGLVDELSVDIPDDQITLHRPDRDEDIKRLVSYVVGCTMGRYSLDKPGLIYAHGGNVGFDHSQYSKFPADPDGIVPVMEADWFADDATNRLLEFLGVGWPKEGLEENLKFIADALGPSKGEQHRDTIRRYLATGFYKHHLQTYKRRPIYWLFSSGKQRAFQALVYLHRYHEGTLSRMRTEYVIPLQGKLASRIDQLAGDIPNSTSTSHRNKLTKERDALLKQQAELQAYDEKLRHYADMRIALDLDDGVKVNYGKFSDLLAEVKAVTGGREED